MGHAQKKDCMLELAIEPVERTYPPREEVSPWLAQHRPTEQRLSREVIVLGTMLVTLQVLDGILTSIGVSRFGTNVEGNPLLRELMLHFGHIPTLAVIKLFAVGIVFSLVALTPRLPWVKHALTAVSGVYICCAIIPWTYLLFIQPLL